MIGRLPFTKMHGLGNCYIYIDGFDHRLDEKELPKLARRMSDRNTGIGSDGVIFMVPSKKAEIKMRIFNKDGSEGKSCGNGLRCVAKYAYEHGLVSKSKFMIETLGGLVRATVNPENIVHEVTVDMGDPKLRRRELPMKGSSQNDKVISESIEVNGEATFVTGVSMGNPHGVFFVDTIEEAPVTAYGPILADHHPLFPEGLNVEFVEMISEREMHFRVWERGSGITQACGTGACAAVVAAVLNGKAKQDEEIIVHLLGGDLKIRWNGGGSVFMTGPAETICEGVYFG